MRRSLTTLTLILLCIWTTARADELHGLFHGEWYPTIGLLKLDQKGQSVTGRYGPDGQFPLKGTATGDVLTFEYEEGQAKGDGRFTIDASRHAFTGGFQVRHGRAGATGTDGGLIARPLTTRLATTLRPGRLSLG